VSAQTPITINSEEWAGHHHVYQFDGRALVDNWVDQSTDPANPHTDQGDQKVDVQLLDLDVDFDRYDGRITDHHFSIFCKQQRSCVETKLDATTGSENYFDLYCDTGDDCAAVLNALRGSRNGGPPSRPDTQPTPADPRAAQLAKLNSDAAKLLADSGQLADAGSPQDAACRRLVAAAAQTGGQVDLAADNACSAIINGQLDLDARYSNIGGQRRAPPSALDLLLDGSNISNSSVFGNDPNSANAAGTPDALDKLLKDTGAASGGQISQSSTTTGGQNARGFGPGGAQAPAQDSAGTGGSLAADTGSSSALDALAKGLGMAAIKGVASMTEDGKILLDGAEKFKSFREDNEAAMKAYPVLQRFLTGQATDDDNAQVMDLTRSKLAGNAIIDPFARAAAQFGQTAANDIGNQSISIFNMTLEAASEGVDSNGDPVDLNPLNNAASLGPMLYGIAKNLPLVGKPIEKMVTAYGQIQDFFSK